MKFPSFAVAFLVAFDPSFLAPLNYRSGIFSSSPSVLLVGATFHSGDHKEIITTTTTTTETTSYVVEEEEAPALYQSGGQGQNVLGHSGNGAASYYEQQGGGPQGAGPQESRGYLRNGGNGWAASASTYEQDGQQIDAQMIGVACQYSGGPCGYGYDCCDWSCSSAGVCN